MTNAQLDSIKKLFNEVQRAVESKQLQPMLRTVYMRTAFQVPYDASVDLPRHLTGDGGGEPQGRHLVSDVRSLVSRPRARDSSHRADAISARRLGDQAALGAARRPWVTDLVNSGALTEVHKFSKFMHGCAVLFPDVAHEVPYWVDDVSLRQSIQSAADAATGATRQHKPPPQPTRGVPSRRMSRAAGRRVFRRLGAHPPSPREPYGWRRTTRHDQRPARARRTRRTTSQYPGPFGSVASASAKFFRRARRFWEATSPPARTARPAPSPCASSPRRSSPTSTFLSWLHTAVLIGTIGAGLVSIHLGKSAATRSRRRERRGWSAGARGSGSSGGVAARGDGGRVLTIVHKHEYRVTFPEGAGANGNFAFSPKVEEGGVGARLPGGGGGGVSRNRGLLPRDRGCARGPRGDRWRGNTRSRRWRVTPRDDRCSRRRLRRGDGVERGIVIALTMLTASVLLSLYATYTFIWRGRMIAKRSTVPFHDPVGPVVMGAIMIVALITLIVLTAANFNAGAVD